MSNIKFGILGCGGIAARFANALAKSPVAELTACAARDGGRAAAFAKEHGAARSYGSYRELLADPEVQAVYIATVHTTHAGLTQMCVEAGKPVLCEKPFFVNGQEAEKTIALAREKGVLIMEGFWTRTQPAYRKVREWLAAGKIGEVTLIRAPFCIMFPYREETKNHRLWDPEVAGGALLDTGVYPYEYVTGLMGEPESYTATVDRGPTGVDRTVAMTLRYPHAIAECLCSIEASVETTATICGTKGTIQQYHFIGSRKAELYVGDKLAETFEDPEEEGFVHEIAHFAELLRDGRTESPLIPLADTAAFARTAADILKKAGH